MHSRGRFSSKATTQFGLILLLCLFWVWGETRPCQFHWAFQQLPSGIRVGLPPPPQRWEHTRLPESSSKTGRLRLGGSVGLNLATWREKTTMKRAGFFCLFLKTVANSKINNQTFLFCVTANKMYDALHAFPSSAKPEVYAHTLRLQLRKSM